MRNILCLISVVGITCASWAQADKALWTNLSVLRGGETIQIVDMKSKKHSGTFVSVADNGISYRDTAGDATIQKPDVRSVKRMANKHRLRNAILGGAVGAGAGAGIGAAAFHPCSRTQFLCLQPGGRGAIAGIGAAVGFAGGLVVGAVWPSHEMIYRADVH
jgi:hypothetical protein